MPGRSRERCLLPGVPVAPATSPLLVVLPHAAIARTAAATRPVDASLMVRDMDRPPPR